MDDESTTLDFPLHFQAFVPVQFDTAWAGQRGAVQGNSCRSWQRTCWPKLLRTDRKWKTGNQISFCLSIDTVWARCCRRLVFFLQAAAASVTSWRIFTVSASAA